MHDSYLSYVKNFGGGVDLYDCVILPLWWKGKYILEAGSGLGKSAYQLAKKGAKKIIGVEYSSEKVIWSKSQYLKDASRILDFIQGSVEDLHFPDNEFDFAYSNSMLEHVSDPLKALKELHRVIKPGGELVLTVDYFHGPGGNHLYDYIYFPWATTLVSENSLCRYWSEELQKDQKSI